MSIRRKSMITLVAFATAIVGAGTAASAATPHAVAAAPAVRGSAAVQPNTVPGAPAGFTTTWSDDFSGASGSGIDSNWKYDTGAGSTFGTGEIETMTSSTSNVYQDGNGNLVLKALHSGSDPNSGWTSGRVETNAATFGAPAGGVVEMQASIQQPNLNTSNGAGYWPAFWMLGSTLRTGTVWPGSGEVDILEDVNSRSSVFGTLHCGVDPGGPCNETTGIGSGEHACGGCQTGYHTYAVQIDRSVSPEQIRWYLDGANYFTVNANQVDATTWANAVDHPFFIILDLAMGGGFPSAFGGGPFASTVSGGQMNIDYVAVYNKAPGGGSSGGTGAAGSVTSGMAGKCLDDTAGSGTDGTKVELWDCNNSAAQQWTAANGTLQINGKCLDITGGGTGNGALAELWDCTGGANQVWQVQNGTLVNPASGRCLDDPGLSTTNGTQLDIWDCNTGPNQQWDVTSPGAVTSGMAGKCLDDFGGASADGTKADLWDCNGSGAQQWSFRGNTLQTNGKCLDITAAGTANGTLTQLYDCNGTGAQTWQSGANGSLVNPASGKCLDDPGLSTTNGTQLDIWSCDGGANQRWSLPA
jgi:beta-glucanase (GH16 family)